MTTKKLFDPRLAELCHKPFFTNDERKEFERVFETNLRRIKDTRDRAEAELLFEQLTYMHHRQRTAAALINIDMMDSVKRLLTVGGLMTQFAGFESLALTEEQVIGTALTLEQIQLLPKSIDILELPPRAARVLRGEKVDTIKQLLTYRELDMMRWLGLGRKSLDDVVGALKRFDLTAGVLWRLKEMKR